MPLPEPRAAARASVQTPDMVAMARLQPPWPSGGGDNILTPLVIAVSRGQLRSWRADVGPHVRLRRVMCSVGFVSWPLPDPGNLHCLLQHHQHHQHPHLRHLVCQTQRLPHQPTQPSNWFSRSRRQELWPGGPGSAPVERASSTTPSHPRHANTATSASVRRERRCGGGCGGEADHRAAGPGRAHRAHWPGTSEPYRAPRTAGPNECGREEESQRSRKAASRKRKEENETAEEREQRRLAKSVENEKQHKKRKQKAGVLACVLYVNKKKLSLCGDKWHCLVAGAVVRCHSTHPQVERNTTTCRLQRSSQQAAAPTRLCFSSPSSLLYIPSFLFTHSPSSFFSHTLPSFFSLLFSSFYPSPRHQKSAPKPSSGSFRVDPTAHPAIAWVSERLCEPLASRATLLPTTFNAVRFHDVILKV